MCDRDPCETVNKVVCLSHGFMCVRNCFVRTQTRPWPLARQNDACGRSRVVGALFDAAFDIDVKEVDRRAAPLVIMW